MIRPYIIDPLESSSIHLDLTLVGWYFEEVEKGLYRPSETLRNCAKETIPGKENQ